MSDSHLESDKQISRKKRRHGPLRALFSVLSAFFGVQSSANRERDDNYGNAAHFILFGLAATIVLVGAIILFVRILIAQAA